MIRINIITNKVRIGDILRFNPNIVGKFINLEKYICENILQFFIR